VSAAKEDGMLTLIFEAAAFAIKAIGGLISDAIGAKAEKQAAILARVRAANAELAKAQTETASEHAADVADTRATIAEEKARLAERGDPTLIP
jgi:hypothetical protein